jgi:hypothetical protein
LEAVAEEVRVDAASSITEGITQALPEGLVYLRIAAYSPAADANYAADRKATGIHKSIFVAIRLTPPTGQGVQPNPGHLTPQGDIARDLGTARKSDAADDCLRCHYRA